MGGGPRRSTQTSRARLQALAERWGRAAEREGDHVKQGIAECAYAECLRLLASGRSR